MDQPANPSPGGAEGGLEVELQTLETSLLEQSRAREAALSLGLKIKAGLLLFVLLYFSFLYSTVASFNPDEAVMMVRGQLEAELPQVKQETIQSMKTAAPEVVTRYAQGFVEAIPSLRDQLEQELLTATGGMITKLQADLNTMTGEMLKESKAGLDQIPGQSTHEKLDRLSKEMRIRIHEESRAAVDQLSGDFSTKIGELNTKIKRLQTAGTLTATEKHQKEMLRVWSKLMQMKMKDVNKAVQEETQNLTR